MDTTVNNERTDIMGKEENLVDVPAPELDVTDGTEVISEACPTPIPIDIGGCIDSLNFDAGDITLESLGRVLQLDVTIKNVCPKKRVALAVFLTELDTNGDEYKRGMKILTIPAHSSSECEDVTVRCIKFILPEDLDVSEGLTTSICNNRQFNARFMSHYIDYDFECCNPTV